MIPGISTFGQYKNINLSGGYFGEVITHPGIVAGIEKEHAFTSNISMLTRLDLGFYNHPRNHAAVFLDISRGSRRYLNNGIFFEQFLGIGTMAEYYNEDVWHIDNNGNAVEVSRFGNFNFMPSVTLGTGYRFQSDRKKQQLLWLRPRIFWQLPFNNLALPHFALLAGYTFTIKTNEISK
jgi:hypothetical protein